MSCVVLCPCSCFIDWDGSVKHGHGHGHGQGQRCLVLCCGFKPDWMCMSLINKGRGWAGQLKLVNAINLNWVMTYNKP